MSQVNQEKEAISQLEEILATIDVELRVTVTQLKSLKARKARVKHLIKVLKM